MMPLIAILAVFGGFMAFDLSLPQSWTSIFLIIGIAVLLIGFLGIALIRDPAVKRQENAHYFRNILYGFRPSVIAEHPKLYLSLIAFAVFGISIQIFMPYLILYYSETLAMENYVMIMAPAVILASVATVIYGRVYDRVGFGRSVFPTLLSLSAGYLLLFFCRTAAPVFLGSLLMMCGYLCGAAVFGAMLRDYTPTGKAGMFQGLRIVSQVLIPGIVGPAIGAAVLRNAEQVRNDDGTLSFLPNATIFLAALVVAVLLILGIVITLLILRRKEKT